MDSNDLTNTIAIVGMAGKFPGADNVQVFWENLCAGKETISSFSKEELINAGLTKLQAESPEYVKSRGILNDVELFDADFFGFNATEAQFTDPQHRLFLECAWEALEHAGYSPDKYLGSIGVYGGMGPSSYYLNNIYPNHQLKESVGEFLLRIGNDKDFLTTKTSYKLNLKGPSIVIQTACSTSLVAVSIACNHLLTYQCDMALAGAASIAIPQISGYQYQEGMILSRDGRCRPFDANAQGTVMSNGVGIVVLKRLEDALADKDHIFALIRSCSINNDGSGKITYSAPSIEGQAEAISLAISMADIDPDTISYVEAHGTGTILGDPVEIKGLTSAFHSTKTQYCALGSVKSNIGHTLEAAGVIGLIKATLALYYRKIPPSLYFSKPNPHIDFTETPFYVNTTLKKWEGSKHPRRACVSSFGIGGTNAHAILEEWNQAICLDSSTGFYSLILSARTLTALKMIARKLGQHLQKYPELSLANVAYTLHVGRRSFEHTRVLVCRDREEAISLLEHFDPANYLPTPELPKENLYEDNSYHRVPLPTYPFEKKRYWVDPPTATLKESVAGLSQHPSVEDALINTWRECLGVKSISIHDDFFRLGGDSLLAIEMAARLSKQFGLPFSMQMLITYPTVAQLSRVILEEKSKLTSLPSLIQLKAGSLASPLFFIHPIEGNLFCYQDLVAGLTCQNPIYGIQAVDEKFKSIEEIATDYIQELRRVQPNGYYYLLGMSFGGIVAYEMARQLKAGGSSVALLCMLDAGNPDPFFTSLSSEEERLAYLAELLEVNPMPGMQCTADKVISRLGLGTLPSKEQEIIFDGVKARLLALANYRPKPYDGKILFFEAIKKTPANRNLSSGSSWKALVKDRIEIQEVSGTHVSMLMQPQVNELISFLERRLTEGYGECQKT